MKSKGFYFVISVFFLIIIGVSAYYILGGFDPLEVFVQEGKYRTVIGNEYIEKYRYQAFSQRIEKAKAALDSGRLEGMMTVMFYENDTIGRDSTHYFIGASTEGLKDVLRVPAGYSYREFYTKKVFKVFMTQHEMVRPRPEKVAKLVKAKAQQEGVDLFPFAFELYYPDGSFSVEYWAR